MYSQQQQTKNAYKTQHHKIKQQQKKKKGRKKFVYQYASETITTNYSEARKYFHTLAIQPAANTFW